MFNKTSINGYDGFNTSEVIILKLRPVATIGASGALAPPPENKNKLGPPRDKSIFRNITQIVGLARIYIKNTII